jgi:hypothetical protein
MIQRLALFIASLATIAVLVVGLTAAGFNPGAAPVAASASDATAAATAPDPATAEPAATPPVQVDTVYLAAPQQPRTIVEHRTVSAPAGGGEGAENESTGEGD